MTRGHALRLWFLWSFLATLLLTAAAQANTLTKVRVAESDGGAQLIFSFTDPPFYEVIPELEHKRLVIHLTKTAAQSEYSMRRFTGATIQDIEMYVDAHPSSAEASEGDLRIEVLLKTSAVMVSHRALRKPAGLMLNIRQTASGAKTDTSNHRREAVEVATREKPAKTIPSPQPSSSVTPAPSSAPGPVPVLSPGPEPAVEDVLQEDPSDDAVVPPAVSEDQLPARSAPDQTTTPMPATPSGLPALEEVRRISGSGTSSAALALLDLYFHRPATFTANPSLLWSVATAYVDLGLYEQGDGLYQTIAEYADHSTLQAAAVLKRGKIALYQGKLAKAERFLRNFIGTAQPGPIFAEAHEALGDALVAQEKFTAATEMYDIALRHTPEAHKPPQLLHKLGSAHRKADQWLKAVEAFDQAVQQLSFEPTSPHGVYGTVLPPSFAEDLLEQLGDSLHKLERYPEAVVAYRRVLEQSPTAWQTAWTLYHLGRSHEALGQYEQAALAYQELARRDDALWAEMGQQALSTLRWRAR